MKKGILIHTTARLRWEKIGSQKVMEKFLLEYWGVFPEDLDKFSLNMGGLEACKTLFRISTKYKSPWRGVGYKSIITDDGKINTLVGFSVTTNGAYGYNQSHVHIAWDGGIEYDEANDKFIEVDNRTDEQKGALLDEIRNGVTWSNQNNHKITSIKGHRDVDSGKACPLFDAIEEYDWIFV